MSWRASSLPGEYGEWTEELAAQEAHAVMKAEARIRRKNARSGWQN